MSSPPKSFTNGTSYQNPQTKIKFRTIFGLGKSKNLRWYSWGLMGVIVAVALTVGVIDNDSLQSAGERAASIARTVRCPQCDGETVAESNAPIAREIRADINRRVSEGEVDDEIRENLAELYGSDIILLPPGEGAGSSLWVIPIVGLSLALAILGLAFWRWRLNLESYEKPTREEEELVRTNLDL